MVILKLGLFNNSLYSNFKQLQLALKPVFSTVHSNSLQLQFAKCNLKPHSKCKKKRFLKVFILNSALSYHRLSLHERRRIFYKTSFKTANSYNMYLKKNLDIAGINAVKKCISYLELSWPQISILVLYGLYIDIWNMCYTWVFCTEYIPPRKSTLEWPMVHSSI